MNTSAALTGSRNDQRIFPIEGAKKQNKSASGLT